MKKIGIYTHWNIPNYGTWLQAYALQKVVEDIRPGDDVRQIAYTEKTHLDLYYGIFSAARYRSRFFLINPKFYIMVLKKLVRLKKIKNSKKFMPYYNDIKNTGELTDEEFSNKQFDCVLVGSDIVWDYTREAIYKKDKRFFGVGLNTKKIIPYAASFGSAKLINTVPQYVSEGLAKMEDILVRDKNSVEMVKSVSGKDASIVIDPTFLWDFWNDNNVPDRPVDYKYIVVYGSHFTKKNVIEIQNYAKDNNLKIICLDSLHDSYKWCDITISQDSLHPYLWCSYLKHAEVVMTCTFHGLILSLIFKKRIVMNPLPFILDKASSFIDYLGLTEVLTGSGNFEKKVDWDWDYAIIDKKIESLKKESLDYLRNALVKDEL